MPSGNKANKKIMRGAGLYLSLLALFQFLIFYIPNVIYTGSYALYLVSKYALIFLGGLYPILAAMLVFSCKESIRERIVSSLLFTLTRLLYTLPYYYLYFVTDVYDSIEALIFAFALSLLIIIGTSCQVFILTLIMKLASLRCRESGYVCGGIFNFNKPMNFAVMLVTLVSFIISFIEECVYAVGFFIDYGASYTEDELVEMMLSFGAIIIFAVIDYIAVAAVALLCEKRRSEDA